MDKANQKGRRNYKNHQNINDDSDDSIGKNSSGGMQVVDDFGNNDFLNSSGK